MTARQVDAMDEGVHRRGSPRVQQEAVERGSRQSQQNSSDRQGDQQLQQAETGRAGWRWTGGYDVGRSFAAWAATITARVSPQMSILRLFYLVSRLQTHAEVCSVPSSLTLGICPDFSVGGFLSDFPSTALSKAPRSAPRVRRAIGSSSSCTCTASSPPISACAWPRS